MERSMTPRHMFRKPPHDTPSFVPSMPDSHTSGMETSPLPPEVQAILKVFAASLKKIRGTGRQEDIAERCGLGQSMYSRLENGKRAPSMEMLAKLSDGLRVEVYQLFGGLPPMKALPSTEAMDIAFAVDKLPPGERQRLVEIAALAGIPLKAEHKRHGKPTKGRKAA